MIHLSQALSEEERAREAVEAWTRELDQSHERLRGLYREASVSWVAVEYEVAHQNWLRLELHRAQERLAQAREAVRLAREALHEASLKRKVMERLKERHAEEYQRDVDRKEQALLDEVGARGYRPQELESSLV